jgi:hypothetical protein
VPLRTVQVFPLAGGFPPLTRDFAALARSRIVALYQVGAPAPPPPPITAPAMPADEAIATEVSPG